MNAMLAGIFGGWEIVLILAVVLILFGAKKLPELAKGLGTGIKEFKKATREVTDEIQNAGTETPAPKTAAGQHHRADALATHAAGNESHLNPAG